MITQNLLPLICSSSLLILLLFHQPSQANTHDCSPSSCGIISNISFPFRVKDDPKHCGHPHYELACENNVAFLYLHSDKYQVKAINYNYWTIRLVDASITNNTCSFPNSSLSAYDNGRTFPLWPEFVRYITFMSCPYPLKNSSLFTEVAHCKTSYPADGRYGYVKVGNMNVSEVKHMCSVDIITMTSWKFEDLKNVSVSEIHDSLLYGFELSWDLFRSPGINAGDLTLRVIRLLLLGLPFPARSIIAFITLAVLFYRILANHENYAFVVRRLVIFLVVMIIGFPVPGLCITAIIFLGFYVPWRSLLHPLGIERIGIVIGLSFLAKSIILLPCFMGLLIYKFRRRHLSSFDAIEDFLQSDNKLMPIRYSYSELKRITRGFQDKLGQGGYGSVYKGKLRSGHYVAVKLLQNPSANGQDFMNEIATIGRIHHVNVVQLVGYCAERSKRALVYDFMPNGSLEKYTSRRDGTNSLSWKRKFEIAVGVARGIEYLHRGCDIQILHFDIKPHNILLDDKFIPKVADFGLAKFFSTEKKTVTLTAARGTVGYVAPELINRGIGSVSFKADVYSFGMLLIEMVGLKKDLRGNNENSSQYFPCWIYDCFDKGKDIETEITDETNNDHDDEENETSRREIVEKMTIVALWCIQMSPDDRPSMNKVLEMLEGEVERLQIPHRPSYSPQRQIADQSWSTYSTESVSLLHHDAAPSLEIIVEDL